jgi:hypothetical protein
MKRDLMLLSAAGALAALPALVMAAPPGGGGGAGAMHGPPTMSTPTATAPTSSPTTTTATPNSPTGNGGGYNHSNTPQHATGQPMQSCETTGSPPGGSGTAPGSAFNQDGGTAGSNYAGEKPVNQRNTASTSQYDVACTKQPH